MINGRPLMHANMLEAKQIWEGEETTRYVPLLTWSHNFWILCMCVIFQAQPAMQQQQVTVVQQVGL